MRRPRVAAPSRGRRSLREFSRCVAAGARRTAAAPSSRSTASRAPPTTSPTKATRRRRSALDGAGSVSTTRSTRSSAGETPPTPPFRRLARQSREHALPIAAPARPARRLPPGRDEDALRDLRGAARLLPPLGQSGRAPAAARSTSAESPDNLAASDAICTALQLINFWQDVAIDWRKGRVYLPQEDLARFGVTEAQIAQRARRRRVARADALRDGARPRAARLRGRPLARALPRRLGLEISRRHRRRPAHPRRASTRVGGDVFRHRPCSASATGSIVGCRGIDRRASVGQRSADDAGRVLPAEGRAERLELLLQLPVPAAGAAARDHRALRVLPRGRRRRRRGHRSGRRAHEARVVAHRRSRRLRRPAAASGDPGARSRRARNSRCREAHLHEIIDGMEMDLDADAATSTSPRSSSTAIASPASSAALGADLRLHATRDARVRRRPRHRLPAHQHHPRRRRRRAPRPHLPAAGRAGALRRRRRRRILQRASSDAFRALMAFQVDARDDWYDARARAARCRPTASAQRAGLIMAAIYRTLLDEIARDGFACSTSASRSRRCASSGSRGRRAALTSVDAARSPSSAAATRACAAAVALADARRSASLSRGRTACSADARAASCATACRSTTASTSCSAPIAATLALLARLHGEREAARCSCAGRWRSCRLRPTCPTRCRCARGARPGRLGLAGGPSAGARTVMAERRGEPRVVSRARAVGFERPRRQTVARLLSRCRRVSRGSCGSRCASPRSTRRSRRRRRRYSRTCCAPPSPARAARAISWCPRPTCPRCFRTRRARYVGERGGRVHLERTTRIVARGRGGVTLAVGDEALAAQAAIVAVGPHQLGGVRAGSARAPIRRCRAAIDVLDCARLRADRDVWLGYPSVTRTARADGTPRRRAGAMGDRSPGHPCARARGRTAAAGADACRRRQRIRPAYGAWSRRARRAQPTPSCAACSRRCRRSTWSQVIVEKRATYACTPQRPRPSGTRIAPGVYLAGDYVDADYPATLEAAVRSGITAAAAVLADRR